MTEGTARRVLIVGGSSAISFACARRLADAGDAVFIANGDLSGQVIDVDGAHMVRQYATR